MTAWPRETRLGAGKSVRRLTNKSVTIVVLLIFSPKLKYQAVSEIPFSIAYLLLFVYLF